MKNLGIVLSLLLSACHHVSADTYCPETSSPLAPLKTDLSPVNFIDGEATAIWGGVVYHLEWSRGVLVKAEAQPNQKPASNIAIVK